MKMYPMLKADEKPEDDSSLIARNRQQVSVLAK